MHGGETDAFGDPGYQGASKRPDASAVTWHIAMRPGKRRALDRDRRSHALIDEIERIKASIRAKVEHPFRVIKRRFGFTKIRYRGLTKNTAQLTTLFALLNLWMVRHRWTSIEGSGAFNSCEVNEFIARSNDSSNEQHSNYRPLDEKADSMSSRKKPV